MFKALQKIALGAMVVVLLFNTAGSIVLLKLREYALEEDFELALKKGQIESNSIVKFSAADIANAHWENNHEIKLNGRYYDLVRTDKINGTIVYEFIADDDESDLFAQYYARHNHHKTKSTVLVSFIAFYYSPTGTNPFFHTIIQTISTGSVALHDQSVHHTLFQPPRV